MSENTKKKHYAERHIEAQGWHYVNHIAAMTEEDLHDKSDIAAELAHRDILIEELTARAERAEAACAAMAKRVILPVYDPIRSEEAESILYFMCTMCRQTGMSTRTVVHKYDCPVATGQPLLDELERLRGVEEAARTALSESTLLCNQVNALNSPQLKVKEGRSVHRALHGLREALTAAREAGEGE